MSNKKEKRKIPFIFECEACTESWSENFLDLLDKLSKDELVQVFDHVKKKLEKMK